ncbi:MAG: polysaccharide biosynthesis C-terminal domain-containing protein [Chitinophagaceae bacterium]|nr:polysaccharide biosynthesis C-terminal domain-containing protein [Chitinophagaceae bacterium]
MKNIVQLINWVITYRFQKSGSCSLFCQPYWPALSSITAGGKKENIAQLLTLLSRCLFFIYGIACLLLALTGHWLFPFVFGDSFSAMYQPFLLLIPGILSLSGLFTLTAYFAGKNQIKTNIIGSIYALLVILAGDMIFIPLFGINAAALVSSMGYMVYQAYIIVVFKKEFKIPLSRFFAISVSDLQQVKRSIVASVTKQD